MSSPNAMLTSSNTTDIQKGEYIRTLKHEFDVVRRQLFAHFEYLLDSEENKLHLEKNLVQKIRTIHDDIHYIFADFDRQLIQQDREQKIESLKI